MTVHDLVLRDARVRRGLAQPLVGDVRPIGITDGRIAAVSEAPLDGREVLDVDGDLVVPSEPTPATAAGGRRPD